MRNFIQIVENAGGYILTEAKSEVVEVFGHDVRVWINPTHREFMHLLQVNFGKLRGTIDTSGSLYVWDPGAAIGNSISTS